MKMLNAWTLEVDDPAVAIAEIMEQLDLENQLLAYSIGIITCSYDYVETGMVKAVCEALPFEVVGCTTLTNAIDQEAGTLLLGLSVLTADDCRFATALTSALRDDPRAAISKTFQRAAGQLEAPPGLLLAFLPMLDTVSGEFMLQTLNDTAAGTPVFGTIACAFDTPNPGHSFTIHNGTCSSDGLSILLISGNVKPHFVVTSATEHSLYKQEAIITSAEGNVLKEINGLSAREYLASLGLSPGGGLEGVSSMPFMINYNDGSQPVARVIFSLNEEGAALCGGMMPEGGTLSIGHLDINGVLLTVEQALGKLPQDKNANGIIIFSCIARNMVLGVTPLIEIEKVREVLGGALPWHLAYSSGELCPVCGGDGRLVNRFHNYTFIACVI